MYADRAIYVSKFEAVDEDELQIASNTSDTEDVKYVNLNSTCLCESRNSSFCNDTNLLDFIVGTNTSFIMKKIILLNDTAFLILVSRDFVSIYSQIDAEQPIHQLTGKSRKEILFT